MTRFPAVYYGKRKKKRLTSFNKESLFTTRNAFNRSLLRPISENPYLNMRKSKEGNEKILAKKCPGKITKKTHEA